MTSIGRDLAASFNGSPDVSGSCGEVEVDSVITDYWRCLCFLFEENMSLDENENG